MWPGQVTDAAWLAQVPEIAQEPSSTYRWRRALSPPQRVAVGRLSCWACEGRGGRGGAAFAFVRRAVAAAAGGGAADPGGAGGGGGPVPAVGQRPGAGDQ